MSCAAGAGVFVKLSRLFVKIHRWALVKMSMNCKLSGSNGSLPANFKLRKQKEPLHGPNAVRKWRRKLLFLWLLAAVAIGSMWFLLSVDNGSLGKKEKSLGSCEEKAQVLLEHFNVSKKQLHVLVSLFSESDQVMCL